MLACVLLAGLPVAQTRPDAAPRTGASDAPAARADKHPVRLVATDCSIPPSGLTLLQADDGRFPAVEKDRDEVGPDRDVGATALAVLARIAGGSTPRSGPYRDEIRQAVQWLRSQQDQRGRLSLRTDPDWVFDHALATYALCEAARTSRFERLGEPVARALGVLAEHLAQARPAPEPELLLWCRFSARSVRATDGPADDPHAAAASAAARAIDTHVVRLADSAVPPTPSAPPAGSWNCSRTPVRIPRGSRASPGRLRSRPTIRSRPCTSRSLRGARATTR